MKTDETTTVTPAPSAETPRDHHECPWWMGYVITSPLRKLAENPSKILSPMVEPGMVVMDVGSAMGFFSLPLARMVGPTGRVVCLDVQPRMLSVLERRARRRNLEQIIETRACTQHDLGTEDLAGAVDLTLAVHVVHESAYPRRFLSQIRDVLCPGGQLVVIEPKGHVSPSEFEATRGLCREIGLVERGMEWFRSSHAMRLEKPRVDGERGGGESGDVATG